MLNLLKCDFTEYNKSIYKILPTTMNTQLSTPVHIEQKLWQHELEMIAEENDFLLNLLVSLQDEHLISTKHQEKTTIFFNYFQYFSYLIAHLKAGLTTIDKEVVGKGDSKTPQKYNVSNFKEEIDCLEKKYQTFKVNFKNFILNNKLV